MLAEFATHTFPPSACSAPMNGVTVWRFDGGLANAHLPLQLAPQHYEASPWASTTCANLALLTPPEQSRYAVFKALELLYLLSTHDLIAETPAAAPGNSNSALTQIVQEVASYMRCHLDERLTIDGLSTRFGVSPTALKKEFRRLYGQPLHAWLQEQRLTQAARLLRESTMTVLEVAQEVGYSSTSQFSAAFVRRFGHAPGQYRRISV